jgi:hypothetical protein
MVAAFDTGRLIFVAAARVEPDEWTIGLRGSPSPQAG